MGNQQYPQFLSTLYVGLGPVLRFCDTSEEFQPMASQLSKKAALPLAKILATCRNNVSNTGPCVATVEGNDYALANKMAICWIIFIKIEK